MGEHRLKTLPFYFDDIKKGIKEFELRKNDRDFKIGDVLILEEWRPDGVFIGGYTGQTVRKTIRYILSDCMQFGLMEGYCILGLEGEIDGKSGNGHEKA